MSWLNIEWLHSLVKIEIIFQVEPRRRFFKNYEERSLILQIILHYTVVRLWTIFNNVQDTVILPKPHRTGYRLNYTKTQSRDDFMLGAPLYHSNNAVFIRSVLFHAISYHSTASTLKWYAASHSQHFIALLSSTAGHNFQFLFPSKPLRAGLAQLGCLHNTYFVDGLNYKINFTDSQKLIMAFENRKFVFGVFLEKTGELSAHNEDVRGFHKCLTIEEHMHSL